MYRIDCYIRLNGVQKKAYVLSNYPRYDLIYYQAKYNTMKLELFCDNVSYQVELGDIILI